MMQVGQREFREMKVAIVAAALLIVVAAGPSSGASEYCRSLEDFLDCRPYKNATGPVMEDLLLQWGREQGVPDLGGPIPADRRPAALGSVYKQLIKQYMGSVVLPDEAPDAGVRVRVGEPYVVMFGPDGSVTDRDGNIAKLGFDRWGHYMFPYVHRLRDGHLLVRVHVGGDDSRYSFMLPMYAKGSDELFNYLSGDGGKNWLHMAVYDKIDEATELPITEIAFTLSDGEEIRYRPRMVDFDDSNIRPKSGNYYRLGDLPADLQWFPMLTRRPGTDVWNKEKSHWDPDTLILGSEVDVRDGDKTHKICLSLPTFGYSSSGDDQLAQLPDGSLTVALDATGNIRPMSGMLTDGTFRTDSLNTIWRSHDRGRSWKYAATIPSFKISGEKYQWFQPRRAYVEPRFADGSWVAMFRTGGIYSSQGGPMFTSRSTDEGKSWSKPRAIRPCSAGTMPGIMLENGIAVRAYGRPGAFLTFCADGRGELWGNDVTLVKPWKSQDDENSCCKPHLAITGPDKFVLAYSKWDVPDFSGKPRLAVIAQEFSVSKK